MEEIRNCKEILTIYRNNTCKEKKTIDISCLEKFNFSKNFFKEITIDRNNKMALFLAHVIRNIRAHFK